MLIAKAESHRKSLIGTFSRYLFVLTIVFCRGNKQVELSLFRWLLPQKTQTIYHSRFALVKKN